MGVGQYNTGKKGLSESLFEKALQRTNYRVKQQQLIEGFIDIDFLLNDNIILNVNGNSHYTAKDTKKLNQSSFHSTKILESLGYTVINFNLYHFTSTTKAFRDDINYIQMCLEDTIEQHIAANKLNKS